MSDWNALTQELDLWQSSGTSARFWWRDDDAISATSELEQLITVSRGIPLALAVISMRFDDSLAAYLADAPQEVSVLPHGAHHANHEPPERKKAEYGVARDQDEALAEIAAGLRRLERGFGDRLRPLFVPPWNRIDPNLTQRLGLAGIGGLSVYNDRKLGQDGIPCLNTHVDVLDWTAKKKEGSARFVGEEKALSDLVDALARRRTAQEGTDPKEAVGLLTHHLEHDIEVWNFLEDLRAALEGHPAAQWIAAEDGLNP